MIILLDKETVVAAYRLLLDRNPENEQVIVEKMGSGSKTDLILDMIRSDEFQIKSPSGGMPINKWVLTDSRLGFRIWVNLADIAVSGAILKEDYEPAEAAYMVATLRPGQTVVDIGSNVGFFSLLMARLVSPGGKVIGFEALPALWEKATASVEENGFSNCNIHNVALGAERGRAELVYAPNSTNWGGAFLTFDGLGLPGHERIPVNVAPLSDFLGSDSVDFLKIDVEGAEFLVLSGAEEILRLHRPIILSELHARQLERVSRVTPRQYVAYMQGLGYQCSILRGDGSLGESVSGNEPIELVNVVFTPTTSAVA